MSCGCIVLDVLFYLFFGRIVLPIFWTYCFAYFLDVLFYLFFGRIVLPFGRIVLPVFLLHQGHHGSGA